MLTLAQSVREAGLMTRKAFPISRNLFQLPKFISFEFQIQIPSNQSQNLPKFKFFIFKIVFILYNVLKYVCLLCCMSSVEEPIFEEEPHILDDPVGDLSEDKGKSHRPS
jgi:hypothetical protein